MSFPRFLFSCFPVLLDWNHSIVQKMVKGIAKTTAMTTPTGMGLGSNSNIIVFLYDSKTNILTWTSGNNCPSCGIVPKTGALSCCAPGGSWHKKCGNPGDLNFEYTWSQGIQACKYHASGAQKQFTSSFQTTISHEFGNGQLLKNTYSTGSVDNDAASPQDGVMVSHAVTLIGIILITLHV